MITAEETRRNMQILEDNEIEIVNEIQKEILYATRNWRFEVKLSCFYERSDISDRVINYIKDHGYNMYYDYGWVVSWEYE
jgi:hypothetical protein